MSFGETEVAPQSLHSVAINESLSELPVKNTPLIGDVKRVSLTNGKRQVGQVELLLGRHWMVKECIDGRIVYVTESVQRSAGKVELQGE
uniref:Uncharacterized protein n=1 Tax=Pristionchus pacificus TaxID=54126 RepID=A0A2A6D2Y9_PRIPA|eukprot:PDM84651.1 hypothetical protein PRIPAC_33674 [Pristionchus pacificus]